MKLYFFRRPAYNIVVTRFRVRLSGGKLPSAKVRAPVSLRSVRKILT